MTGPDDHSSTRPISVAELLAKNGTIGAPPVGGRRRRRRGNSDAVTVAELTGEIPIIRPDEPEPAAEQSRDAAGDSPAEPSPNGAGDGVAAEPGPDADAEGVTEAQAVSEAQAPEHEDVVVEPESDDAEDVDDDAEDVDDEFSDATGPADTNGPADTTGPSDTTEPSDTTGPADTTGPSGAGDAPDATDATPARRFGFGRLKRSQTPEVDAEQMSPDPIEDTRTAVDADTLLGAGDEAGPDEMSAEVDDLDSVDAETDVGETEPRDADDSGLPSYLRSSSEPLFGGQTVADDVARRAGSSGRDGDESLDTDLLDEDPTRPRPISSLAHGAWIVGQSLLAVVFGAGLFVAFDQLWKWNNIVALVLSVLVILGLVVGVRVVRKTEDIGSTLIAVAVGALVTLGPLALLQSS